MIDQEKVNNIVRLLEEKIDKCKWTGYGGTYKCIIGEHHIILMKPYDTSNVFLSIISSPCHEIYTNIKTAEETFTLYYPLFKKVHEKREKEQFDAFKDIMDSLDKLN